MYNKMISENYKPVDENLIKITEYTKLGNLPNPFVFENGTPLVSKDEWKKRRDEIYKSAVELQYGIMPPSPEFLELELLSTNKYIDCYSIRTGTYKNPIKFTMTLMKPEGNGPFPTVVDGDMCFRYFYDKDIIKTFTDNGIMLALFNRVELAPDIRKSYRNGQIYSTYPEGNYGAIAAWAWGYSRCVDALEKIGIADKNCIVFTGHSRGGKTAMLAGAVDERATIVNPNETCAGGCSCYRLHVSAIDENSVPFRSETLKDIVKYFPFWFNSELAEYAEKEEELPFDSHYLKALVAPRVLFVSEAGSDLWANPIGSWQTTMAATEVYKFLDAEDKIFWYYRNGYHEHNIQDMHMLVNLILHIYKGEPLSDNFFRTPFKKPEFIFEWKCPENDS